ncbi:MAG: hypothetical protein ACPGRD_00630 [Planktomarina sp.]
MSEQAQELELTLFYGQSWISRIGPNRRQIDGALHPETALMLDDGRGVIGWNGKEPRVSNPRYVPAYELESRSQSICIPYLFRRAARVQRQGQSKLIAGRGEGTAGAPIRKLLRDPKINDDPRAHGFENLMSAIDTHVANARGMKLAPTIPYVVWCQGAGDGRATYRGYRKKLEHLFDEVSAAVLAKTKQPTPPMFLIIQPPGRAQGGNWKCLQVQVDLAFEREDCILAMAGWPLDQYDHVHFSGKSAVIAGELLQIVAHGIESGDWVSAPFLTDYKRDGATITARISGPHDIKIDETHTSPRHTVAGAPVPNYGFTAYGAEIKSVEISSRHVEITLDRTDGKVTIGYAWHKGEDRATAAGTRANQSANRGSLRAKWRVKSQFTDDYIHQWLASGYHTFEG